LSNLGYGPTRYGYKVEVGVPSKVRINLKVTLWDIDSAWKKRDKVYIALR
jgi:hypothetical protein